MTDNKEFFHTSSVFDYMAETLNFTDDVIKNIKKELLENKSNNGFVCHVYLLYINKWIFLGGDKCGIYKVETKAIRDHRLYGCSYNYLTTSHLDHDMENFNLFLNSLGNNQVNLKNCCLIKKYYVVLDDKNCNAYEKIYSEVPPFRIKNLTKTYLGKAIQKHIDSLKPVQPNLLDI